MKTLQLNANSILKTSQEHRSVCPLCLSIPEPLI